MNLYIAEMLCTFHNTETREGTVVPRGRGGEDNWDVGIDMHTSIPEIINKDCERNKNKAYKMSTKEHAAYVGTNLCRSFAHSNTSVSFT